MNATAHDLVVDLSPDESGEAPDLRVGEEVALWVAFPVAIVTLIAATLAEVAYHALIVLRILLGLPLTRLDRATARRAAAGAER
jgi:hypothetical protein